MTMQSHGCKDSLYCMHVAWCCSSDVASAPHQASLSGEARELAAALQHDALSTSCERVMWEDIAGLDDAKRWAGLKADTLVRRRLHAPDCDVTCCR